MTQTIITSLFYDINSTVNDCTLELYQFTGGIILNWWWPRGRDLIIIETSNLARFVRSAEVVFLGLFG